MRTTAPLPKLVSLKRIAIDDEVGAMLAAESRRYHIPAQDLAGAAVAIMVLANPPMQQRWHAAAAKLLRRRLDELS